jgi:hypothetical protein
MYRIDHESLNKQIRKEEKDDKTGTIRLILVILVGTIETAFLFYITFNFNSLDENIRAGITAFSTALPLLVAAPIALLIWSFRDQNKLADIQTAREDLIQKDFHEIQQWATGHGEPSLHRAAIYQLIPYAIGEHGYRFRRPTFEIYYALLEIWEPKKPAEGDEIAIPQNIKAIHTVFREKGRELSIDMQEINLPYANLDYINLQSTFLSRADLHSADLNVANLQSAILVDANLHSANLYGANLRTASLWNADLRSADIKEADLQSAEFIDTEIIRARNWDQANYSDGVLIKLGTLYEELKAKGKGGYWDPVTEKYVEETKKKE